MRLPNHSYGDRLRQTLRAELASARKETDRLFQMLSPAAIYERPIPERHRIIFYLGHLEAFDWNMICGKAFGVSSLNPEFERLFAFGIDPVDGKLPQDNPKDWPSVEEVRRYNQQVRQTVDELLDRATLIDSHEQESGQLFRMVIEHRLMHAETLAYMLQWLPYDLKDRAALPAETTQPPPEPRKVEIPAGRATLGQNRNGEFPFGWDNEFQMHTAFVPEFSIDAFSVTNRQFLEFLVAGGYEQRIFWDDDSWAWIQTAGIRHPKFWIERGGGWCYRTMFAEIPLPLAWPVYVSHAEAAAYARWARKSLPTEAQYHRAAFGSADGSERYYPWGNANPMPVHGNFDFQSWTPSPVGSFQAGQSELGVFDLCGNGWEWTGTPFEPFAGFEPFPFYPGYSADFFDGKHFVLKGASPRTSAMLVRRPFRNWFQPHYPNIYAKFRCVEN